MKYTLQRLYHTKALADGNYSCGFLTNEEHSFRSWVLEDQPREQKVKGETRIPADTYDLAIREFETEALKRHRIAYSELPWFKNNPTWRHIEVTKVQGFSGILIHAVGDDKDTMGCIGPGYVFDMTKLNNQQAGSRLAVNDFYAITYPLLQVGKRVQIQIINEQL